MQGMSSNCKEVSAMLSALVPKVQSCKKPLSVEELGNALLGMKNMNSDIAQVGAMLSALAPKVQSCKEALTTQAVSNALYGLRKMSSNSAEVRTMLFALIPKVRTCKELDAQAVGKALFGMKGMSSDRIEVRKMLTALVPPVQSCREPLSAKGMGMALFGMQSMSSERAEVRAMLAVLVHKIESCEEPFDAQAVGNALFGMQGMSSDNDEVHAILSALVPKVQSCREPLSAQNIGMALYGIHGMSKAVEFSLLVNLFYDQLKMIAGSTSLVQSFSTGDLTSLSRYIVLTLCALRSELKDEYESWETINNLLANELNKRQRNGHLFFSLNSQSNAERQVYDIAKRAFLDSDVSVSSNEYLCNIFEADIVLRIPIPKSMRKNKLDRSHLILNIEVDGTHHQRETTKRFCMQRDR
jgi:hypothetical protein